MTCREWEERIAVAARDGDPDAALYEHMAGCIHCLQFARQMAVVAEALSSWEQPATHDAPAEVTRSALVERLAAIRQPPEVTVRRSAHQIAEHPSIIAVTGAAAMVVAAAASPGWIQWAFGCWAAVAVLTATLVLLHHDRPDTTEGEF